MKKKVLFVFLGAIALLFSTYVIRYKFANTVNNNNIPNNATSVININLRNLEHHFLMDVISNPKLYLSNNSKKSDSLPSKKQASIFKELVIPSNLQFYTVDNDNATWFSSILKINNVATITEALKRNQFNQLISPSNITIFKKTSFYVIIHQQEIIIVKTNNYDQLNFKTLFNKYPANKQASPLLETVNTLKSDVNYTNKFKDIVEMNFNNGEITITGNIKTALFKTNKISIDSAAIFSIAANFNSNNNWYKKGINSINAIKFKKFTKLDKDSVFNQFNGKINFNLQSFNTFTDTILTYDYDADFNKIEIKKTHKTNYPNFELAFNSKTDLLPYLKNENTINTTLTNDIFIPFPLIETMVKTTKNETKFYTLGKKNRTTTPIAAKFYLFFDFNRYRESTRNTLYAFDKMNYIKNMELKLSNTNIIDAKIIMNTKSRNALVQFIK